MSVEPRKIVEAHAVCPALNRAKLNFEQGQVSG
jgi:hypothetical protein